MENENKVSYRDCLNHLDYNSIKLVDCVGHVLETNIEKMDEDTMEGEKASHSHDYFELCYIIDGKYNVSTDKSNTLLNSYDLIIYEPHCEHGSTFKGKHDGITVWFEAKCYHPYSPTYYRIHDPVGTLRWLFEQIYKESRSDLYKKDEIVKSFISSILLYSQRYLLNNKVTTTEDLLENVLHYIDIGYNLPLTINQLSSMIHLSKSHFYKVFSAYTGDTPLQYINKVRIEKAKKILNTTRLSVSDIAFKVGFEDPKYFSRIFHQHTGVAPRQWRNTSAKKL